MDINIITKNIKRNPKPYDTKLSEKKYRSQKEKTVRIYTGTKLWHKLNDYAKKEGVTRSRVTRKLLEHFLDEIEKKS
tara:strand:+ start:161 stop:391 length:231 start_codon:yes stop_codon:yes gene_type:complete